MSKNNLRMAFMSLAKTEERKSVICPCGEEMHFAVIEREAYCGEAPWFGYYTCDCGWMAPSRTGDTPEDCERNAYAAAIHTPPNSPLTQDQIEKMPRLSAVWVYFSPKFDPMIMSARDAFSGFRDDAIIKHPIGSLFFAQPPAQSDIEAALSAKGENQ